MKKITKRLLIWMPVSIVVIAVIVVGSLFYFNSNYYRFRTSAFYGEYARLYSFYDWVPRYLDCDLYEENEDGSYTKSSEMSGVFFEEDKYLARDRNGEKHDMEECFEEAVTSEIKKYFDIFDGKCIVKNNEIEFLPSGETLKIVDSKFLYELDWHSNEEYPIRRFKTMGGSLNLNGSGEFLTNYSIKGDMFRVYIRNTEFSLKFSDTYISGVYKKYKLSIRVSYFNIDSFNEINNRN